MVAIAADELCPVPKSYTKPYINFDGKKNFQSKNVYLNKPSEDEINKFIERCCNSEHPQNLFDLAKKSIEIKIVELIIK